MRALLLLCVIVGGTLLRVAVANFFFGAELTVNKQNLLNPNGPVISKWVSTHEFEAIFNWKNLILGFAVLFLSRTQGALYFMNSIKDDEMFERNRKQVFVNGLIFVLFFLTFVTLLLTTDGYQNISKDGIPTNTNAFEIVPFKYFHNFIHLWWMLAIFLIGVVLVLYAVIRSVFGKHFTKGIWFSGIGTILVVIALFSVAVYNANPFSPSLIDASSSLTIYNSSSSHHTLESMSYVSLIIPVVVGYIAYAWYAMNKKPITRDEVKDDSHSY